MLKEHQNVSQSEWEPFRRWWWSDSLDLTVWYDDSEKPPIGFQLCYKQGVESKALTFMEGKGYRHETVDEGDVDGGYKRSPILVADGVFDKDRILNLFKKESVEIDENESGYVIQKLEYYE